MEGRGLAKILSLFLRNLRSFSKYVPSVCVRQKKENGVFQSAVSLLDIPTRYSGFQKQVAWTSHFSSMCSNVSLGTSIILKTVRGNGDIMSFFIADNRFYTGSLHKRKMTQFTTTNGTRWV